MCARFVSKDKKDKAKNCGMCINYNFANGKCKVAKILRDKIEKKVSK
jgi:hypothetical protein